MWYSGAAFAAAPLEQWEGLVEHVVARVHALDSINIENLAVQDCLVTPLVLDY